MKRLFSGNRSATSSPKPNEGGFRSASQTLQAPGSGHAVDDESISPELSPIITLISAQAHRRYHEGVFMLLQSINSEGEPVANRRWREVYGVLLGTQLAVWNIEELEKYQNDTEALINASSKPDYINFTDSSFRAVDKLENNQGLKNVIIVSTTLKNQFLLQYPDIEDFQRWNSAFRLSTFEYTSLQEAYTGALLSARGSKLSDIRTILAETKFNYEDWVSVRFGSGMPWKRCYAVIEQPSKKSKGSKIYKGTVSFFKDEKKNKKAAMAIIKDASAAYALYPNAVKMVDHSTMIKLEGTVFFETSKKALPKEASVYFMPEQHSAVPGYDTLIRFLIPLLNTFNLYGRPKRLNANKNEMNSLLFGLPVLPHVHYLEVDDLVLLSSNASSSTWLVTDWRQKIKEVLARKLGTGYTGCGSSHGLIGAMNSPAVGSQDFMDVRSFGSANRPMSPLSPSFLPQPRFRDSSVSKASSLNIDSGEESGPPSPQKTNRNSEITQIYEDYSGIVKANEGYKKSTESLGRSALDLPGAQNTLYHQKRSVLSDSSIQRKAGSLSQDQRSQNSNPYSNFKHDQNENELDEDFDDDDVFKKGLSDLKVEDDELRPGNEDVFNPGYGAAPSTLTDEPQLAAYPKSNPVPAIKVEQAYTSGRISQQSPVESATTSHPYLTDDNQQSSIQKHSHSQYQSKPHPQPQLQSQSQPQKPGEPFSYQQYQQPVPPSHSSIPRSQAQKFPPLVPQEQVNANAGPFPDQQKRAVPSQSQGYTQQSKAPPQQQYIQGPPAPPSSFQQYQQPNPYQQQPSHQNQRQHPQGNSYLPQQGPQSSPLSQQPQGSRPQQSRQGIPPQQQTQQRKAPPLSQQQQPHFQQHPPSQPNSQFPQGQHPQGPRLPQQGYPSQGVPISQFAPRKPVHQHGPPPHHGNPYQQSQGPASQLQSNPYQQSGPAPRPQQNFPQQQQGGYRTYQQQQGPSGPPGAGVQGNPRSVPQGQYGQQNLYQQRPPQQINPYQQGNPYSR